MPRFPRLSSFVVATSWLFLSISAADLQAQKGKKTWDKAPKVDYKTFSVLLETQDDPMFQHPVLGAHTSMNPWDGGGLAEWRKWPIMGMSKKEILNLIPKQVGLLHLGCPACNAGPENAKHDFNDSSQLPRQWGHWEWDYRNPETYRCKKSGERYPENSKFPMTNIEYRHNRLGEKIKLRYWLDTAKDKKGFKKRYPKYYLDSQIDYFKMKWCQKQLGNLIAAYILSGDEDFAYKAAIIVDGMCEVFPHWLYMKNYAHGYLDYRPGLNMKSTYTRTNSRRGESWSGPIGLGRAYDIFFNSEGFKRYSKEIGDDLRVKYLSYVVKFIKPSLFNDGKLPDKGMDGWQQGCPGHGDIKTGKLLHDPRYMHRFADHMKRIPFEIYASDGGYLEGSGYTCLQLNPMMKMRDMNGYSDPKGFVPPKGFERIENWWYPSGPYELFHRKAYTLQRELARPDGRAIVYNDCGGSFPSATYIQQTPKPRSFNVMKHGLKHVVLGDGAGDDQIQTHMIFGMDSKHGHDDRMSLQIYAKGHYMVDDITYPKHRMRSTYSSVVLHNTGVIDGRGHAQGPVGDGKPEIYEPRFHGLSAVRIDGENLYVGNSDIFERTLINVTIDPKTPYVVDLFRMDGGRKWRDYMLLGSYKHHATAELSVPTRKLPGDRPLMRPGAKWQDEGRDSVKYDDRFGLFTNVRAVEKGVDFKLTYTMNQTRKKADGGEYPKGSVGMVNHFIGMQGATPYLTEIPRRVDKPGSTMKQPQMPQLIYRDEDLKGISQFICVHEPFKGEKAIERVRKIYDQGNTLALQVAFKNGRKDVVILTKEEGRATFDVGGVSTDAKMAVLSRSASGKMTGWMIGGTYLKAPGLSLDKPAGEFKGEVVRSLRKWDGDAVDGFEIKVADDNSAALMAEQLTGAWVMMDSKGVQDAFYAKIINNDIQEWYSKYHKRSLRKYQDARKKDPRSEYVLNWEENQRRWDACKASGAGWSFEIERVIQKAGKLILVTREDHGLKIDGTFTKELFFPNRQLKGAATTWWINTAASSLPMKKMTPDQTVVRPDELAALKEKLMSWPQDGSGVYRYIQPKRPSDFETEIIVDVTDAGVKVPADSQAGLLHVLARHVGKDEKAAGEQGLISAFLGCAAVNDSIARSDMRQYIFKPKGSGAHHFKGYLKVPADGIYTFYYRAGGNGEMRVGGKVVSPRNRYLGAPYPRIIKLKMKAGYVPFEAWSSMRGTKYWSANNELGWEGPGFERRPMAFGDFRFAQSELDEITGQLDVNQLGVDDDRESGIRQDYLVAQSFGGGEVYLNGDLIGTLNGGRNWYHSTNLKRGDVIILKAKAGSHKKKVIRGAALGALRKGKPLFKSEDCRVSSETPGERGFKTPRYANNWEQVKLQPENKQLKHFNLSSVWHDKKSEAIWLKYVVK